MNDGCKIKSVSGPLRGAAVCERRLYDNVCVWPSTWSSCVLTTVVR